MKGCNHGGERVSQKRLRLSEFKTISKGNMGAVFAKFQTTKNALKKRVSKTSMVEKVAMTQ
jgi:hypothetical protein